MFEHFEAICSALLQPRSVAGILPILDPTDQFKTEEDGPAALAAKFNAAFMIIMAGKQHPEFDHARNYLSKAADSTAWKERQGWNLYYDTLDAVERALDKNSLYANDLKRKAQTIIDQCAVGVIKR
jgi:hypothetical protein